MDLPVAGSFDGVQVAGAYNSLNSSQWNSVLAQGGSANEHRDVHAWYYGTITDRLTRGEARNNDGDTSLLLLDNGVDISESWYGNASVGMGPRDLVGYNRSRIGSRDRAWSPSRPVANWGAKSPVGQVAGIFNGDFSYGDRLLNDIPGWDRHGGEDDADLTDGMIHLGETDVRNYLVGRHNRLFIPPTATKLAFDYKVTDPSNDDTLVVKIGDTVVDTPPITGEMSDFQTREIDIGAYQGSVNTIEFRLNAGLFIGSDVYIDNVRFMDASVVSVVGDQVVSISDSRKLTSLVVGDQGRVCVAAGADAAVRVDNIALNRPGSLDLNDNALIVTGGSASRNAVLDLTSGYVKWGGIMSSINGPFGGLAALVNDKGDGTALVGSLGGQSIGVNDVIVKYTWNGDANIDGLVNADDYFQIDSGYISQNPGWYNGDFNYDNVINADDYFLIDSAFIGQTGPLATARASAPAEPPANPDPPATPTPGRGGESLIVLNAPSTARQQDSLLAHLFAPEPILA